MSPWSCSRKDGSFLLRVYVQPKASKNEIVGLHGDALKIRLTSPPVDGKANKALVAFIARTLSVPKRQVTLQSGQQNRNKVLKIEGVTEERLQQVLTL